MNSIFQKKIGNNFLILGPNKDCGCSLEIPQWGGSNKQSQPMFPKENWRNDEYPCKPHFSLYKVGV